MHDVDGFVCIALGPSHAVGASGIPEKLYSRSKYAEISQLVVS